MLVSSENCLANSDAGDGAWAKMAVERLLQEVAFGEEFLAEGSGVGAQG